LYSASSPSVVKESADLELSDTAEAREPMAQEEQRQATTKQGMKYFILNSNNNRHFPTILELIVSPKLFFLKILNDSEQRIKLF
jgi:hypothetical protein